MTKDHAAQELTVREDVARLEAEYHQSQYDQALEIARDKYGERIQEFLAEIFNDGTPYRNSQILHGIRWEAVVTPYLARLSMGESLGEAAKFVRSSPSTLKSVAERYPSLKSMVEDAVSDGFSVFETEARERAVRGRRKLVISMGKIVRDADGEPLYEFVPSDNLLMFMMRARMPEVYGERKEISVSQRTPGRVHDGMTLAEAAEAYQDTVTSTAVAALPPPQIAKSTTDPAPAAPDDRRDD